MNMKILSNFASSKSIFQNISYHLNLFFTINSFLHKGWSYVCKHSGCPISLQLSGIAKKACGLKCVPEHDSIHGSNVGLPLPWD